MRLILAIILAAASSAPAAVKVGNNVLANPIFESDQLDVPGCWNMTSGKDVYVWSANGGPKSRPAVTFDASRADGGAVAASPHAAREAPHRVKIRVVYGGRLF